MQLYCLVLWDVRNPTKGTKCDSPQKMVRRLLCMKSLNHLTFGIDLDNIFKSCLLPEALKNPFLAHSLLSVFVSTERDQLF